MQIYVYQWNIFSWTPENPKKETMEAFLARHPEITDRTVSGLQKFFVNYVNSNSPNMIWYVGTEEGFEAYKLIKPIILEAKEGKFAINLINITGILDFIFKLAVEYNIFNRNNKLNELAVDNLDAQYLIESSKLNRGAINRFTDHTKNVLIELFSELEKANTSSLGSKIVELYDELKEILIEFENVDNQADLPKQLVTILEIVHQMNHANTLVGANTLAGELANSHTGAKK